MPDWVIPSLLNENYEEKVLVKYNMVALWNCGSDLNSDHSMCIAQMKQYISLVVMINWVTYS